MAEQNLARIRIYDLPRLYDLMVPPGPCEAFYCGLAKQQGDPILELACGTGRLSIPLAEAGHEVVGLDSSPQMLKAAHAKANVNRTKLHFVEGDMRSFRLDRTFALVIASCNSLAHLTEDDDLFACLDRIAGHLTQGGLFAFDVVNPELAELARPMPLQSGARRLIKYDSINQVQTILFSDPRPYSNLELAPMRLRLFFPREIPALLRSAGLTIVAQFGDFDREELSTTSRNQVYVAALARRSSPRH